MFDSAYCGGVDPNDVKVDTEKLQEAYEKNNPKSKLTRRPRIKIICKEDFNGLEDGTNNFLLSVCTKEGFQFHGFDWKKTNGFASGYYVGVVSYSYLEELG